MTTACAWWPATTCTTPTPENGRLGAAIAAVRARRSLAEMDGWLPGPGAHLRSGAEMARLFARYPGRGGGVRSRSPDQCAFDLQLAKPRLPKQQVPLGHTPISWLRELCRRGADERYPQHPGGSRGPPARKELAVIEEKDFPGYFLIVHDMVDYARGRGHPLPGPGFGSQLGGLLRAGHHRGGPDQVRAALRAVPVHHPGGGARHRRRLRLRPPRGGDPGGLPPLRPAQRRPGGERDQLPAQVGGPGHGQGAGLLHRPAGRLVASRSTPTPRSPTPTTTIPAAGGGPGQPAAQGAAAPGHPLRRHGADRAAGRGGVPDRAGPDGRPHRPAVGQGQLCGDGAGQVRLPGPGHPRRHPVHLRPGRRTGWGSAGPCTPCPRRRPASTTCSAGPTPSGSSRWRAGPRSARCPGCSRAASTTWWWRSG